MAEKKHYDNIDGLRTIAAIMIVLMHVMANIDYILPNNPITTLIAASGNFVQLFFLISGFGLCCGYYERVKNNNISINDFFKKRYIKILPYFTLLVLIDVAVSLVFSRGNFTNSLIEAFSDLTLFFGFFPNANIEVIGVGWTLGVIFAFYCLFPFFVFLLWTKKRVWLVLILSIGVYYVCTYYFTVNGFAIRCNVARWLCYFIAGGIIYLYREEIERLLNFKKWIRWIVLPILVGLTVAWFFIPNKIGTVPIELFKTIIMFSLWLMYAISYKSVVLANPVTKFMSNISFEIYLAHMLIFRVVEKLKLTHIFSSNVLSYIFVALVVLVLVIGFAFVAKYLINKVEQFIKNKMASKKEVD